MKLGLSERERKGVYGLGGFADTRGSSKYNFNLSMWRAQMVASYLAQKGGDIGKIKMAAYGKEVAKLLGSKHAEAKVAVTPGIDFGKNNTDRFIRISFAKDGVIW